MNADLKGKLQNCRILLAEDCSDTRLVMTKMLESSGAEVTSVENGEQCVASALQAAEAGTPFDILLLDIQMPVLDGQSAARQLRDQGYRGIIVAVTARYLPLEDEDALRSGFDAFLNKTSGRENLISTLERQLQNAAAAG